MPANHEPTAHVAGGQTIDYNRCGMDDVIRRSLLLHPSLLADRMRDVARIHHAAACTFSGRDTEGGRIARQMQDTANDVANEITLDIADPATWTFGARVMTFSAAARLQCLTPALTAGIAAREG